MATSLGHLSESYQSLHLGIWHGLFMHTRKQANCHAYQTCLQLQLTSVSLGYSFERSMGLANLISKTENLH